MFIIIEALNFCLPVVDKLLRVVLEAVPFPVTSGHIIRADRLRKYVLAYLMQNRPMLTRLVMYRCMAREHQRKDFLTAIMEDQKATGLSLTDRELQSNAAALL